MPPKRVRCFCDRCDGKEVSASTQWRHNRQVVASEEESSSASSESGSELSEEEDSSDTSSSGPELSAEEDPGDPPSDSSVSSEGSGVEQLGPEDSDIGEEHDKVKSMMPISFPNECNGSGLLLSQQRNPGKGARKRVCVSIFLVYFFLSHYVCVCSAGK